MFCGCKSEEPGEIIIEEGVNEINMAIYGVDTYNPIKTQSESVAELLSLIYEPLFEFDENLMPIPVLAEKLTFSSDFCTVKLSIAKGKKWHNGEAFTADDVIYTINEIKNGISRYKDNLAQVTAVQADIDGDVLLSLSEPVMNIEGLLSFPIIRNGSAEELDENMNGTGVFYLAEKNVHNIVLLPKKDTQTSVSAVNVSVMRSAAACVNAFEMGEVDCVTSTAVDLKEKTPAGDIQTKLYTTNQMTFLGFNCSLEKYKNPNFRLAVTDIISRSELVEKVMFAKATECKLPFNPESALYAPAEGPQFDIDGVMTKAGYVKKDGRYTNADGTDIEITILVNVESSEKISAARIISDQLKKQGISATVEEVDYQVYKRRISDGEYDAFIGEVKMRDNLDPSFLTEANNMFRYEDKVVSDALRAMKMCESFESLKTKIADYERAFSLNPPFAPLYYRMNGVVYKESISGITTPNFYDSLKGIENIYFKANG